MSVFRCSMSFRLHSVVSLRSEKIETTWEELSRTPTTNPVVERLFFCSFWSKLSVGISWHQHFRSGFLACGTLSRSGRDVEGIQMLPLESSQVFGILQETRLQGLEPLPSIVNKRVLYIFSNTPPRMYPDLHVVQSYDLELVCFCCSTTPVH